MLFENETITIESYEDGEFDIVSEDMFEPVTFEEELEAEKISEDLKQAEAFIDSMEQYDVIFEELEQATDVSPAAVVALRAGIESAANLLGTTAGLTALTIEDISGQEKDQLVIAMEAKDNILKRTYNAIKKFIKKIIKMISDFISRFFNTNASIIKRLVELKKKTVSNPKKNPKTKPIDNEEVCARVSGVYYIVKGKKPKKTDKDAAMVLAEMMEANLGYVTAMGMFSDKIIDSFTYILKNKDLKAAKAEAKKTANEVVDNMAEKLPTRKFFPTIIGSSFKGIILGSDGLKVAYIKKSDVKEMKKEEKASIGFFTTDNYNKFKDNKIAPLTKEQAEDLINNAVEKLQTTDLVKKSVEGIKASVSTVDKAMTEDNSAAAQPLVNLINNYSRLAMAGISFNVTLANTCGKYVAASYKKEL